MVVHLDDKITNLLLDLDDLRFQKSKQLLKERDLIPLFKKVHKCINALGENLYLLQTRSSALAAKMNNLILAFKDLFDHFEKRKERKNLKEKHYKEIKQNLNRLKYISFKSLKERILEIAMLIDNQSIHFSYFDFN